MTLSCLYAGQVSHTRLRPKRHFLRYRLFQLCLDLDEAEGLSRESRLFGFNRPALLSVWERDHLKGNGALRDQVEGMLRRSGLAGGGPIRLLCLPRVLGFVFNPISLYFCHARDGSLSALIYEVNNTFGDRHCYVLPAARRGEHIVHGAPKAMHVSPFMDMDHDYDFRLTEPGERFQMTIKVTRGHEPWLSATFDGHARAFTDYELFRAWLAHPLVTLKVVAGIHVEALRLWLKGMKYRSRPPYPATD